MQKKRLLFGTSFFALCFVGLFIAGTLAVGEFLNLPVPCGESPGCDEVASHPASRVLGIPLAYLGVAVYLALAILLLRQGDPRILVVVTALGATASGYLLHLSVNVIEALCIWCFASAAVMGLLFLIAMVSLIAKTGLAAPSSWLSWTLAGALVVALGGQAYFMRKQGTRPPIPEQRLVAVGIEKLASGSNALGPPDAPVTIVQFANFTCGGCRSAHQAIKRYRANNVNAVRWIYRHKPLRDVRGHELSGTLAVMGEIAAESGKFWEFADAIYGREKWTLEEIFEVLKSLGIEKEVVQTRLNQAGDPAVARVASDEEFAEELGVRGTPTFVVILRGHPPKSAAGHGLEAILNSEPVIELLKNARRP